MDIQIQEVKKAFNEVVWYFERLKIHKKTEEDNYKLFAKIALYHPMNYLLFNAFSMDAKGKRRYPEEIDELPAILNKLLDIAQISPQNKAIIQKGVKNYITAQKNQINDQFPEIEDGYLELDSSAINDRISYLRKTEQMVLKALGRKDGANIDVMDLFPKAPGKDDTNEIEHGANPMQDDERKINPSTAKNMQTLDTMRNRHAKYKAGGSEYDYCYSELGFDVELTKAKEVDITKDLARQTILAQILKESVLYFCSIHYYYHYKLKVAKDEIKVRSDIVTDMKETEINPYINRFNANSQLKHTQANLRRYEQGYYTKNKHLTLLDKIDESEKAYFAKYLRLFSQLPSDAISETETAANKFLPFHFNEDTNELFQDMPIKTYYEVFAHDAQNRYTDKEDIYKERAAESTQESTHTPVKESVYIQDKELHIPKEEHYKILADLVPTEKQFKEIKEKAQTKYTIDYLYTGVKNDIVEVTIEDGHITILASGYEGSGENSQSYSRTYYYYAKHKKYIYTESFKAVVKERIMRMQIGRAGNIENQSNNTIHFFTKDFAISI